MNSKRLLLPLILSLSLALVFLILPGFTGPEPLGAQAGAGIRYVATTGVDTGACTLPGSPCRTVQYAVDVAAPADEIRVAAGVYSDVLQTTAGAQVVRISKPVVIRGGYTKTNWTKPDAVTNATILNAMGRGRVIVITGPITVGLEGLSLVRGDAAKLGGGPSGADAGGGIYASGATLWINGCWIAGNRADFGGGVFLIQGQARITASTISGNTVRISGGGIYLTHSPRTILTGNAVVKNTAGISGGGLLMAYSPIVVDGNDIGDNQAPYGGGLDLERSDARLTGNVIRKNVAARVEHLAFSYDAGGVALTHSDALLDNNVIAENSAANRGAGVYVWASRPQFRHTTFAANTGGEGSGLHVAGPSETPSEVTLENSIVVSHTVGVSVTRGSTVTLEATLWGTGSSANGTDNGGTGTVATGTINLWSDPGFVNALTGNYHLRPTSAAIDAGVNASVDRDIDREHRPFGEAPDLGADELPLSVAAPAANSNFVYTDTRGITLAIQIPAEAVTRTTRLVFTPVISPEEPISPGLRFGGRAFDLDAYWDGALRTGFTFRRGVTVTVQYSDTDVADLAEGTLRLYYWNARATAWIDAATTCTPPSRYRRSVERNVIQVPICHLSRYSMQGAQPGAGLYVPLIIRN